MTDDSSAGGYLTTRDLGQIAALIFTGHRPESLTQRDGILTAVFAATPKLHCAVREYILDETRVAPRAFLSLLRDLKGVANVQTR